MSHKIVVTCLTDSPKITTGFGNVARMLLQGFHDNGLEVRSFGMLDDKPDIKQELPYTFWPDLAKVGIMEQTDLMLKNITQFLINNQPDIIFMMYDPGTIESHLILIEALKKKGYLKEAPVVVYTPIEGFPVPATTRNTFAKILNEGGRVVTYSPGSIINVTAGFPELDGLLDYAYHGLDHANFYRYDKDRKLSIKKSVGLEDQFIVGSIGVNKRTKGFDTIIYTARCLKDTNRDQNIKFYLHTNPLTPVLQGYNLIDLAEAYDVEDMIIFKPDKDNTPGGNRDGVTVKESENAQELADLGFIDRINILDMYLDLSQVEGWGLPAHEAMRCGIPTVSVDDHSIRSEILEGGAILMEPLPFRIWNTWHNGVKLALIDPALAADTICRIKDSSEEQKEFLSNIAVKNAEKYNWLEAQTKISNIIKETYNEMSSVQ